AGAGGLPLFPVDTRPARWSTSSDPDRVVIRTAPRMPPASWADSARRGAAMSRPPSTIRRALKRTATLQSPSLREKYGLDVRRDTPDLRDLLYVPTLVEVPSEIPLARYQAFGVPILDQGQQGACTGYGLATVIHYLLRVRKVVPDQGEVSPHML